MGSQIVFWPNTVYLFCPNYCPFASAECPNLFRENKEEFQASKRADGLST